MTLRRASTLPHPPKRTEAAPLLNATQFTWAQNSPRPYRQCHCRSVRFGSVRRADRSNVASRAQEVGAIGAIRRWRKRECASRSHLRLPSEGTALRSLLVSQQSTGASAVVLSDSDSRCDAIQPDFWDGDEYEYESRTECKPIGNRITLSSRRNKENENRIVRVYTSTSAFGSDSSDRANLRSVRLEC